MNTKTKHFPHRALAILLTLVLIFSALSVTAFAGQEDGYHDPAEHWMLSNDRTVELDVNATVTKETFLCVECGKVTSFQSFRVPEYTRDGQTALTRNVKYSDGTLISGQGKGATMEGVPGKDAYYTGYHWTKSICENCGHLNSNHGRENYCYGKNVYSLNDCAHDFMDELDETVTIEYVDDVYHKVTTSGGNTACSAMAPATPSTLSWSAMTCTLRSSLNLPTTALPPWSIARLANTPSMSLWLPRA